MNEGLRAGAARVSIAPTAEDLAQGVYLGGFGGYRARRATAVLDEPECRAIAVSDGHETFVLAALDLVGASAPLLQSIRDEASRVTGLDPEHIIVACTHSHASPDTQGLWGGVPDAYRTHVAHRGVSAIWEAQQAMVPAIAASRTVDVGGGVQNRRGWPETDETLTILRLSSASESTIATLVNYACHPTAIGAASTEVSRDWCGFTFDAVEREAGGIAVYINGAIGDVIPRESGSIEAARNFGESVASAAVRASEVAEPVRGAVRVQMRAVELPWSPERLSQHVQDALARGGFALAALSRAGGMRAASAALHTAGRADLAQIVAALGGMSERRLVRRDGRTYLPALCGHVGIGDDLELIAAPGELLTRLALPLRRAMGSRHRIVVGLAHETLGYFVPEDEWMTGRNGDYEESVSLGRRAGTVLADALLSMLPKHGVRA